MIVTDSPGTQSQRGRQHYGIVDEAVSQDAYPHRVTPCRREVRT